MHRNWNKPLHDKHKVIKQSLNLSNTELITAYFTLGVLLVYLFFSLLLLLSKLSEILLNATCAVKRLEPTHFNIQQHNMDFTDFHPCLSPAFLSRVLVLITTETQLPSILKQSG